MTRENPNTAPHQCTQLLILSKVLGKSFLRRESNNPGTQCGPKSKTNLTSSSDKASSLEDEEKTPDKIHLELRKESDKGSHDNIKDKLQENGLNARALC